jgi:hypothetical protein
MRHSLPLLSALALVLLACGYYGPPERPHGPAVAPTLSEADECESPEKRK